MTNPELIGVVLLVAMGTYLTRFLPMYLSSRNVSFDGAEEFLSLSSTALISALFVTSFLSAPLDYGKSSVAVASLASAFAFYKKWRNTGISVFAGVATHFLLMNLLNLH